MLRQELIVPDGLLSQEELGRRAGATADQSVYVLVDRKEAHGFVLLIPGVLPEPGERAVIYAFDPRSDEDLLAINAGFSADYYLGAHDAPWPDERAVIEQVVPERGAELLEICCGAGRTAPALVQKGNRVVAIDLSEPCIRHAAGLDRAGVDYRVADATALPFAERSFDLGLCFENSLGVFFSRRSQVVAELVRVSRAKVVLGLREVPGVPDDKLQIYSTRSGFLEVAQVHSRASTQRILDGMPDAARARISGQRWLDGAPRPWGGREFYLILDLR